jgi:sodium/pantothenate symporter
MNTIILGVMLAYFVCLFFIGWYANKKTQSVDDYYVGGRKLGGILVAFTYMASLVSAGALVGWTSLSYKWGMFFIFAATTVTVSTFLCWYFLGSKVMRTSKELNMYTIPDFLESRFESKAARLVASVALIVFMIPLMVAQYKAAGLMVNMITGIPYDYAVILFGAIVFLYVAFGGYLAVVYTDIAQGLIMLVGISVLLGAAFIKTNGLLGVQYAALNPGGAISWPDASSAVSPAFFLAFLMLTFFGALGAPNYIRGFYALKSGKALKQGFVIIITIVCVLEVVIVLLGLYGRVLFPELKDSDMTVLTMMKQLLPPFGAGLTLAALAAAMMSTMDSILIVCTSTVENDILKHSLGYSLSPGRRVLVAQLTTLVIGIISVIWGLYPPKLLALLFYPAWGVLGLIFAIVFFGGLYWKRFNAAGVITAMVCGSVTFVGWHLLGNPFGLYHIQVALLVTVPLTIIATYLAPPTSDATLARFFKTKSAGAAPAPNETI